MARAAGDRSYYTFNLWNEITQQHNRKVQVKLPSSTHVVKTVLANNALPDHIYRQTRDMIAGIVAVLRRDNPSLFHGVGGGDPENDMVLLDILEDGDVLEELLKENGLTSRDILKMHSDRGTREHATLERLARAEMRKPGSSLPIAEKLLQSANGWERGTASFWMLYRPTVLAAEMTLPNAREWYCGTCDLVWENPEFRSLNITDLKTRLEGKESYESDEFQVDSYDLAWVENGGPVPDVRSVLVVREDGSFILHENFIVERGDFLELMDVYRTLKRKQRKDLTPSAKSDTLEEKEEENGKV